MPPALRLELVSGPARDHVDVVPRADAPGAALTIGRSNQCDVVLEDHDGVLSRRHSEVAWRGDAWQVTDLTSKHGTWINGNRLAPGTPTAMTAGDRLRIGAWTFRVVIGGNGGIPTAEAGPASASLSPARVFATQDDRAQGQSLIKRLAAAAAPDSQRRLDLLIQSAQTMQAARSEVEIAEAALGAVSSGSGFPRCAFLRTQDGGAEVEVVAQRTPPGGPTAGFSRSLLVAAADGETVVLNGGDVPNYGQSIVSLDICSAVCAPVAVDGHADAFLYADTRGREGRMDVANVPPDLAAYVQAVARLAGLALSNLHRRRLERDDQRRRADLEAARGVQRIIMPPAEGRVGRVAYHMVSIPGRFVAGDLFDVVTVRDDAVAVLLGDVVGKGIAAGMVMANVQAHLSRLLRSEDDPASALSEVNRLVAEYGRRAGEDVTGTLFLSLWAGVFDTRRGVLRYCDAGHGFWVHRPTGGLPRASTGGDCLPLGVDPDAVFTSVEIPIASGDRVVVFSDGVIEQRGIGGEQFGIRRALESLAPERAPREDAQTLLSDLTMFAAGAGGAGARGSDGAANPSADMSGEEGFADDVTIASIAVE